MNERKQFVGNSGWIKTTVQDPNPKSILRLNPKFAMSPNSEAPSPASAFSNHTDVPSDREIQSLNDLTCHGNQNGSLSSFETRPVSPGKVFPVA